MTDKLLVRIAQANADAHWGQDASLSFDAQGAFIHISDEASALKVIQKAGRTLSNQGVSLLALAGDDWTTEMQWALYQGFVTAKKQTGVTFVENVKSDINELNALVSAAQFLRELTNGTPNDIYPERFLPHGT